VNQEVRERTLKSKDGIDLSVRQNNVKNPLAVVVIVHGICEHSGRYDAVASNFNKNGFSVYRFDLHGHGRSGGDRGYVDDLQVLIDDADSVVNLSKEENPGLPIFMLGHSMGGLISAIYGVRHPDKIKGQVLSGAAVMILPAVKGLLSFDYNTQARSPIPNSLSNVVSRDPKVVEAYNNDQLVLKTFTMKLMGEAFIKGGKWITENMASYECPCLILHGSADQIVPPEASKNFYEHIGSKDKDIKIYEGLYHEILNEPEKETVMLDIDRWIKAHM
jgi:alpha-beta hydrolase superfamily lysophospholipase